MQDVLFLVILAAVGGALLKSYLLGFLAAVLLLLFRDWLGDLWQSRPILTVVLVIGALGLGWCFRAAMKADDARRRPRSEWMLMDKKEKSRVYKNRGD